MRTVATGRENVSPPVAAVLAQRLMTVGTVLIMPSVTDQASVNVMMTGACSLTVRCIMVSAIHAVLEMLGLLTVAVHRMCSAMSVRYMHIVMSTLADVFAMTAGPERTAIAGEENVTHAAPMGVEDQPTPTVSTAPKMHIASAVPASVLTVGTTLRTVRNTMTCATRHATDATPQSQTSATNVLSMPSGTTSVCANARKTGKILLAVKSTLAPAILPALTVTAQGSLIAWTAMTTHTETTLVSASVT